MCPKLTSMHQISGHSRWGMAMLKNAIPLKAILEAIYSEGQRHPPVEPQDIARKNCLPVRTGRLGNSIAQAGRAWSFLGLNLIQTNNPKAKFLQGNL